MVTQNNLDNRFLRHALATLAYRCGKVLQNAPKQFENYKASPSTRTSAEILAHICDLLAWTLALASNQEFDFQTQTSVQSQTLSWQDQKNRFYFLLQQLDDFLASGAELQANAERLFQGPLADALTHTGQLAMLRRMAGSPVRGENYFEATIVVGNVGSEQHKSSTEFD